MPSLSPEAQKLLDLVIRFPDGHQRFLMMSELPTETQNKPWVLDELFDPKYVVLLDDIHLVPTLLGLRASRSAAAQKLWQSADATAAHCYQEYRRGQRSVDLITNDLQLGATIWMASSGLGPFPTLIVKEQSNRRGETGLVIAAAPQRGALNYRLGPIDPDISPPNPEPLALQVSDYRGLRQAAWAPRGLTLLVGPNGSGKSSLLQGYEFFSQVYHFGLKLALQQRGAALKRIEAAPETLVRLVLQDGPLHWAFEFLAAAGGIGSFPGETVTLGDQILVHGRLGSPDWYLRGQKRNRGREDSPCLRMAVDAELVPEADGLVAKLAKVRVYPPVELSRVRQGNLGAETDDVLDKGGGNLAKVLCNWKAAARKYEDRFEWVLKHAKSAFPDLIADLELDAPVGGIVAARFFKPGSTQGLPLEVAADGLLVGLLHLTAVAGATPGSWVAIDEMENQLHPYAIEVLLNAFRERVKTYDLTIVLTTHSPVLMNFFRSEPGQIYVTTSKDNQYPVPLDQLHDPDWLAHFYPGELYEQGKFGAPGA